MGNGKSIPKVAVKALSAVVSLMPLSAVLPTGWPLRPSSTKCRAVCFKKTRPLSGRLAVERGIGEGAPCAFGSPRLPTKPQNSDGVCRLEVSPEASSRPSCRGAK